MPKIKTRRSAAKRFSFTKSGLVKRANANRRHLLNGKAPKRMRALRKTSFADKTNVDAIKKMLPYA
ncbi:MAG: 50S ribosomal protein L35 [Clostridia bacterium]|nr:50S ribosomal protein L35 [Clostridia bacterium]